MSVFDYALETPSGTQRLSRARAKGAAMRGELRPDDHVLVARRDPPETRRLSVEQLRTHFELLDQGVEDPFLQMEADVISPGGGQSAPPAVEAASRPPRPEPDPEPDPDEGDVEATHASAPPEPQEPDRAPAAPPVERLSPSRADAAPSTSSRLRERLFETTAVPLPMADAGDARSGTPQSATPSEQPAQPEPSEEPEPPHDREYLVATSADEPAPWRSNDAASRGQALMATLMRFKGVIAASVAAVVLVSAVLASALWFMGREQTRTVYAGAAAAVYAQGRDEASLLADLRPGEPLLVATGGEAPPPEGWLRVLEPERVSGGFVRAAEVDDTAPPEVIEVRFGHQGVPIRAAAALDADTMATLDPGAEVSVVVSGGPTPPADGWAQVIEPSEHAGGFVETSVLSPDPLPEVIETRFAAEAVSAFSVADDTSETVHTFDAGAAVALVVSGGRQTMPPGWARVASSSEHAGLFVPLAQFDAAPAPVESGRFYANEGATALADVADDRGRALPAGLALDVVSGGGDRPPPPDFGRITEPRAYAERFVALSALSREPAAEQTAAFYAVDALETVAAPPEDVWTPSADAQAPSGVEIARGEPLTLIVRGGRNAPPEGWGLVVQPERAAGGWVELEATTTAPVEERLADRYASERLTALTAPSDDAEPRGVVAVGQGLSVVESGGATPPPFGWARVAAPADLAGAYVPASLLSESPLAEERAEMFTVGAVDAFERPDLASDPLGTLPRGSRVDVITQGGTSSPPDGWALVVEPSSLAGGYVERDVVSTQARPDMQELIGALWIAAEDVALRASPSESGAVDRDLEAGEDVYVVGLVADDWVEARSGRSVISYAPLKSFQEAEQLLARRAPQIIEPIGNTWWSAAPMALHELPDETSAVLMSIGADEPVMVTGRIDATWVQVLVADGAAYANAADLLLEPAPVITEVQISRPPSARAMTNAFPRDALARGVSGLVELSCVVAVNGRASRCDVVSEQPVNLGFGEAAQELAKTMRFTPRLENDEPVRGGTIVFTLEFNAAR